MWVSAPSHDVCNSSAAPLTEKTPHCPSVEVNMTLTSKTQKKKTSKGLRGSF